MMVVVTQLRRPGNVLSPVRIMTPCPCCPWLMLPKQDKALHLLPALSLCFGAQPSSFTRAFPSISESAVRSPTTVDVPSLMLKSLVDGDLDKAMALGSISADVAFAAVAGASLAPAVLMPSEEESTGSDSAVGVSPAVLRAESVLRTLVRGTAAATVARVLRIAKAACGTVMAVAVAAMLRACGGDEEALLRAQQVIRGMDASV